MFVQLIVQRKKETQSSALLSLCKGSRPVTDVFPSQIAINAQSVSISWRHCIFNFSVKIDINYIGDSYDYIIPHRVAHVYSINMYQFFL